MTVAQREAYVCQMFSTNVPSALEIALGSDPAGFTGSVCTPGNQGHPGPILKSQYVGMTPTAIADKKMPYFMTTAGGNALLWQELWAEAFSFLNGGQGVGAPILRFTDNALTAGVAPNASMHCARYVVNIWLGTGNPPTPTQLQGQGCFGYQQTDFYHQ